ncbi:MAG TPA: capsule assembly Wzi family protein [Candidatus Acidoferrum sp.]|nr:capsule assembly Wzi family protein [Candidatus Acidoferrum sp.]
MTAMLCGSVATTWLAIAPPGVAGKPQEARPVPAMESTNAITNPFQPQIKPVKRGALHFEDEHSFTAQHNWRRLGQDFLEDQRAIWTSPAKLSFSDTQWLVPIAGVTAGLLETDAQYSRHLSHTPSTLSRYNNLSNASLAALAGGAGGMWFMSLRNHDQHWRETGFLAGEAAINTMVVVEAMKYASQRERPFQDAGQGLFFQNGGVSFPSEHAAVAWAVAGVISHEYPGPLPKLFAYGLASVVSFSRVRARQHFPSDVFIGGLVGDMIAQQTYTRHHDPELGGALWNSFSQTFRSEAAARPGNQGSPYVPLDSWVYPLFDRLSAMGYVKTGTAGQRPWTRLECARLLSEALEQVDRTAATTPQVENLLNELAREFSADTELLSGGENQGSHLESAYTRFTGISGPPLTDSYHFGQTLTNDFGRPYQEGLSNVTGTSGWATAGRWIAYVRGEYQYAPSGPAYSETVRDFIANIDSNPVQPATPVPSRSQFQLLDAYVGLGMSNWQLSFGQQSLCWGPGRMGPFLYSDNAAPARMIQLKRVAALRLPWLFRFMGPVFMDAYFGNLDGHHFPSGPAFHGEKISFKPTENLELGFSRSAIFAGAGHPLTFRTTFNSYFTFASPVNETPLNNPGKQSGGFDFSYRMPFVRDWLTLYCDSIADDDPSPLAAPRRAGVNPGIYLPKLPYLNKFDFRLEAAYTDVPHSMTPGEYIYWDRDYHDLYVNDGQIFGDPVGRDGKAIQAWSRYWIGPRTNLEFSYRHAQVSPRFVPGGGTINDASVRADFWFHQVWNVNAAVQYEQWSFPILANGPQANVTSSLGITFSPVGGHFMRPGKSEVPKN